ncbi:MAG: hypothetical protein JO251_20765 [Verrucomicrobia bacterium]|nr:hypothetical protein [Verrucomicrobiota bacterium]
MNGNDSGGRQWWSPDRERMYLQRSLFLVVIIGAMQLAAAINTPLLTRLLG